MMASETMSPEPRRAAWSADAGWLSRVGPWTDDRPDPAHWLPTMGLESALQKVKKALRAGFDPIVVSGPAGHGKTLLLRSLRTRPPGGLAPIFVPFSNVGPDELAAWILEAARQPLDRAPAARLVRLLRANARFSGGALLLMDEVQATPYATLSKLFEIIGESDGAVSVVLAGLPGEALDLALTAVPYPIREVEVSEPWSRADVVLLLTQVARALRVAPSGLIAAIDVDAALSDGAGNPRLVRAALAARLHAAELARERIPRVVPFARAQPPARLAAPAPLDCTPRGTATPIPSAQVPAAARSQRTPSPVRREQRARAALPARSRAWRTKRGREWIAASWRRAMQVFVPASIRLRRSTAKRARGVRAWLDGAAWRAHVASQRAARSIRTHGHRMDIAARARTSAVSARLRSRALAHGETIWRRARGRARQARAIPGAIAALAARIDRNEEWKRAKSSIRTHGHRMGIAARVRTRALSAEFRSRSLGCGRAVWKAAREWVRQVQATAASARLTLGQGVLHKLTAAAQPLQRGARLPPVTARSALAIAGAIAALAVLVADGRARAPVLTEVSQMGNEAVLGTAVEPIPFRMNSHPWSTVAIDGVEAGTTPFTIPLEPGPHHFRVAMADGRILEQIFVVSTLQDRLAFR